MKMGGVDTGMSWGPGEDVHTSVGLAVCGHAEGTKQGEGQHEHHTAGGREG